MRWETLLSTERLTARTATTPDGNQSQRRNSFQRDFDRIAYSTSFRRLQNKTQVHTLPNNDHVRNRLTHSLEASTLARSLGAGIGRWLGEQGELQVSPELVGACAQAATLAHDIGNPPFGHPGEAAIQDWFKDEKKNENNLTLSEPQVRDFTAFNGNSQGFRVLTQHAHGYDSPGLQLTCATLAAFTKYPESTAATTDRRFKDIGLFVGDGPTFSLIALRTGLLQFAEGVWARHPLAFIVEAADDIAYLTADIEDGVELGILPLESAKELFRSLSVRASVPDEAFVTRLRSVLIGSMMDDAIAEFTRDYDCIMSGKRASPLLALHPARERLKETARAEIFSSEPQIRRDLAGKEALEGLLQRLARTMCDFKSCGWSLVKLRKQVPHKWRLLRLIEAAGAEGSSLSTLEPHTSDYDVLHRVVDYIAGQTDRFAIELWRNVRGIEL